MKTIINQLDTPETQLRELLDELQSFEHVDGVLEVIGKARSYLMAGNIEYGLRYTKIGWNRVARAVNGYLSATAAAYENAS